MTWVMLSRGGALNMIFPPHQVAEVGIFLYILTDEISESLFLLNQNQNVIGNEILSLVANDGLSCVQL